MIKIFFILISLLQVIKTQIKDHRPVYIPDKNITIDNGLNDNSRFLDDSSSSSSLLYLNPISYQYIISSGILEYLTFTLKAVNLKSTVYYSYSSIRFSSSSNITIINVEFEEQETNYTFTSDKLLKMYFKLKNEETLTVKITLQYNQNITSLYRSEYIYIPYYFSGTCKYNIEVVNAKSLGLLYDNFTKLTPSSYYYNGDCPGYTYYDFIRMSPYKVTWKTYNEYNILGTNIIYLNLTVPDFFKGGNNDNFTEYIIEKSKTNGTETTTYNDTHYIFTYSNIQETSISLKMNSTFTSNYIDNMTIYYSDDKLLNYSTEKSMSLVQEIFENDTSSNPEYYIIGKWIYSNLKYNKSLSGKTYTIDEIIEYKTGVCEHFTLLYLALLNSIGIKAVYAHGYSADEENIYDNPSISTSTGHAWVIAYINNKWIGLDATWGIVEGNLPISHIYVSSIYNGFTVRLSGSGVKYGNIINKIEFVEIVDVICEDYYIKVDGNCKLCKDINENKPYYDVYTSQCVSLCDYVMFNNVCYESCDDLSNEDTVYVDVDGICVIQESEYEEESYEENEDTEIIENSFEEYENDIEEMIEYELEIENNEVELENNEEDSEEENNNEELLDENDKEELIEEDSEIETNEEMTEELEENNNEEIEEGEIEENNKEEENLEDEEYKEQKEEEIINEELIEEEDNNDEELEEETNEEIIIENNKEESEEEDNDNIEELEQNGDEEYIEEENNNEEFVEEESNDEEIAEEENNNVEITEEENNNEELIEEENNTEEESEENNNEEEEESNNEEFIEEENNAEEESEENNTEEFIEEENNNEDYIEEENNNEEESEENNTEEEEERNNEEIIEEENNNEEEEDNNNEEIIEEETNNEEIIEEENNNEKEEENNNEEEEENNNEKEEESNNEEIIEKENNIEDYIEEENNNEEEEEIDNIEESNIETNNNKLEEDEEELEEKENEEELIEKNKEENKEQTEEETIEEEKEEEIEIIDNKEEEDNKEETKDNSESEDNENNNKDDTLLEEETKENINISPTILENNIYLYIHYKFICLILIVIMW